MISPDLTSCLMIRTCSCVSCSLSVADLKGKRQSTNNRRLCLVWGMECGADILETGFMNILVLCSSRNILFPYAPLRQGSRISWWVGGSMVYNQLILLNFSQEYSSRRWRFVEGQGESGRYICKSYSFTLVCLFCKQECDIFYYFSQLVSYLETNITNPCHSHCFVFLHTVHVRLRWFFANFS